MTATPIVRSEVTFSNDPLAFGPQVTALADDTFTIVWQDGTNIFGKQLDSSGNFTGGDFLATVTSNDSDMLSNPIAYQQTDGRVVVTYNELSAPDDTDVLWHRVNTDFTPDGNTYPVVGSSVDEFQVAATARSGGGGAVVYEVAGTAPDTHTVLEFVDSVGNPASNKIFVGAHAGESQTDASTAGLANGCRRLWRFQRYVIRA
jgi:hypothetical protein